MEIEEDIREYNMPEIPCIENKCISYPVCMNKRAIRCDFLFNYANEISPLCTKHTFPNLSNLESDRNLMIFYTDTSYSVYYNWIKVRDNDEISRRM